MLVAPRVCKAAATILASLVVIGICAAVVVLRWHYPTDALGGACVGIGAVLFLDGWPTSPGSSADGSGRSGAPASKSSDQPAGRSGVRRGRSSTDQPSARDLHRARYEG